MDIIGIVATDSNGAIGKDGTVPWRYPADTAFFKRQTVGHACIMGAATWRSIPQRYRPLPDRTNIILSRSMESVDDESVIVLPEVSQVLEFLQGMERKVFVIGGAQVYAAFLDHITAWVVTTVPVVVEGADTFMPAGFRDGFIQDGHEDLGDRLMVRFYRRE